MVTVTKVKKSGAKKPKCGELLHNDQDAMEYYTRTSSRTTLTLCIGYRS